MQSLPNSGRGGKRPWREHCHATAFAAKSTGVASGGVALGPADNDQLAIHEFLDPKVTEVAAETRSLDAAER